MSDAALWPLGDDPAGWPTVSVVMPIRNEAENLRAAVEAVLSQEYPRMFDVCLAIGPSTDGTQALAADLAATSPKVKIVSNPTGRTPTGLNTAIRATTGEVVVRVDGHARLCKGYIKRAVETMSTTGAWNVGGLQIASGTTPCEKAIAAAQSSRVGTGGARYRVGGSAGPVDTVYLGVFLREAIEAVDLYDERLVRNQDYELNIRLRKAGGTIWFDPTIYATYRPRGTLRAVARQYYEYGWWKAEVASKHRYSLKPRQLAPILVTVAVISGGLLSVCFRRALLIPGGYVLSIAIVSRIESRNAQEPSSVSLVSLATVVMHLGWGAGFIRSWTSKLDPRTLRHRY